MSGTDSAQNKGPEAEIQQLIFRGFGIGVAVLLITFISTFGGSYMMNKLIYHGSVMRIVAGIIGSLPPISLIVFLFALTRDRVSYFSLFPIGSGTHTEGGDDGWTWRWILAPLLHPFRWVYDKGAYTDAVSSLLVAPGSTEPVVDETLIEKAQAAARLLTAADSQQARSQLVQ